MRLNKKNAIRNIFLLLIIFSNVACDQVTKTVARQNLDYHTPIEVVGKHLILNKVENTGAFLSLGNELSYPLKIVFLNLLPLLAMVYGIYFIVRYNTLHPLLAIGVAFVIGGGLGNLYDRFIYHSVTDFLYMEILFVRTGIFNMADVSIMLGTFAMLWHGIRHKSRPSKINE